MTQSTAKSLSEFLQLKSCPQCDYSLETLPLEGICPECGRKYDQSITVINGISKGDAAMGELTWRSTLGPVIYFAFMAWLINSHRRLLTDPNTIMWIAISAIGLVAHLYAGVFSAQTPKPQLWISSEGIAQSLSTAEGRRARWLTRNAQMIALPAILCWLLIMLTIDLSIIFLPLAVGAPVFIPFLVWTRWKKFSSQESTGCKPELCPWKRLDRLRVDTLSKGRIRIRCSMIHYWKGISTRRDRPVDIIVNCPEDLNGAFRKRILEWSGKWEPE